MGTCRARPSSRSAFFLAFLLVYLIGWFNLETAESLAQWTKGMVKFVLHFLFLIAGVALIARRGMRFYWLTLAAFVGGIAANGAYGLAQLAVAETTGANLDEAWLQPITGGASKINIFGAIEGSFVYRVNALTGDPNHLGIEVAAAILLLLPIYLRLERGHRLRVPLALLLAFLMIVDLATLSGSGLLGLGCGFLVLAIPYRRMLLQPQFLVPLGLLLAGLAVSWRIAPSSSRRCSAHASRRKGAARTRTSSSTRSSPTCSRRTRSSGSVSTPSRSTTSSRRGRRTSGRTRSTSRSFVEYGLVGTLLFAAFLVYLFRRAGLTRRIGRSLAAAGDPLAARSARSAGAWRRRS